MSNVIPFPRRPADRRHEVVAAVIGKDSRPLDTVPPFREIKRFTTPAEELIFKVTSNEREVQVHQSLDVGETWELALVASADAYRCWMNAFWINEPNCEDSESFLEMVRFLQSGYVLPNGSPVPNWRDPAKKWAEIQRSGAVPKKFRERHG